MVLVCSTEGTTVCIPDIYVPQSLLLSSIISCTNVTEPIPIQMKLETLELVVKFMMQNNQVVKKNYEAVEIRMSPQMLAFLESLSNERLSNIANAANYLNCPVLLELTCRFIADKIQNRPLEEIRDIFGTKEENTSEDAAEIERDFGWLSSGSDVAE